MFFYLYFFVFQIYLFFCKEIMWQGIDSGKFITKQYVWLQDFVFNEFDAEICFPRHPAPRRQTRTFSDKVQNLIFICLPFCPGRRTSSVPLLHLALRAVRLLQRRLDQHAFWLWSDRINTFLWSPKTCRTHHCVATWLVHSFYCSGWNSGAAPAQASSLVSNRKYFI